MKEKTGALFYEGRPPDYNCYLDNQRYVFNYIEISLFSNEVECSLCMMRVCIYDDSRGRVWRRRNE